MSFSDIFLIGRRHHISNLTEYLLENTIQLQRKDKSIVNAKVTKVEDTKIFHHYSSEIQVDVEYGDQSKEKIEMWLYLHGNEPRLFLPFGDHFVVLRGDTLWKAVKGTWRDGDE